MRVAILSEFEAGAAGFSGIPHFMEQELARHVDIVRFETPVFDFRMAFEDASRAIAGLKGSGKVASTWLRHVQPDVVLCQGSSMIPFLEAPVPVVLWHDSTWHTLLQMDFATFEHDHPLLAEWDRRVFARCDHVVFAADWVLVESLAHYDVEPSRLSVIPFGPSTVPPDRADVTAAVMKRFARPCKLIFIGRDWRRKGLPLAAAALSGLNRAGFDASLEAIGPMFEEPAGHGQHWSPADSFDSSAMLTVRLSSTPRLTTLGTIDKTTAAGAADFRTRLLEAHYLLHPAEFECFGVAMVEALSFGVPVLALNQHGAKSIVRDGYSGRTFLPDRYVEDTVHWISRQLSSATRYEAEAMCALNDYEARFTWEHSCRSVVRLFERLKHPGDVRGRLE